MKRLALSFVVMGTALALAAGGALAQATTQTFEIKVPLDGQEIVNPCTGEPVQLTGQRHILFHITEDANGGFHAVTHLQLQGVSGTGLVSGQRYKVVGVTRDESYFAPGELRETMIIHRFHIVSGGPSDNWLVNETIHVTFNANGEPTAEVLNFHTTCEG
jgi:hypothetical protein